jgi:hypothetical protein
MSDALEALGAGGDEEEPIELSRPRAISEGGPKPRSEFLGVCEGHPH